MFCRRVKNLKAPVLVGACGVVWRGKFIEFLLVPSGMSGSANLSIKTWPRLGPVLSRTVGHLASRVDEFGLLDFHWLLAIEGAFFAVGVELVVSAVGLHHKAQRFPTGR